VRLTEVFKPNNDENLNLRDYKSILFVGSVSERKGVFDLLKAFPKVAETIPSVRLTIVGPGDHLQRAKEHAVQCAYHDQIRFVGPVSRQQAAVLTASTRIFVCHHMVSLMQPL
jgi:glycosyltransferase involved in cell wall biosynthesis